LENIALWHERDISHSSVERIIIPDSTILVDYMLNRLKGIVKDMHVYPERMKANMERSYGLFNSQRVLLALIDKGMVREEAYLMVQRNAMESWGKSVSFRDLLIRDKDITKYLTGAEIMAIFDLDYYLRNIDFIFNRVFAS
jgi:adenylosuccinate lyase